MTNNRWVGMLALVTAAALLAAPVADAQSIRGSIQGTVTDDSGAALPGVSVTVSSPALQGTQTIVTEESGAFRIAALPAGVYKVVFALDGFQTIEQEEVRVGIGAKAQLDVKMTSTFTEQLIVTSERPTINTSSAELGAALGQEFFLDLPIQRNFTSVARVTPGAQADDSGQTFYGSSGAENAYYIDGVNTTGIELGQQGKTLNFEFIQEVQVKTAGYGAEYGRSTGGLINVITKSGGNEFKGDVFGYWDDESLQSNLSGEAARGAVSGTFQVVDFTRSDFGADLGGYFIKDKLWFFVAVDQVTNEDTLSSLENFGAVIPGAPALGDEFIDKQERDLFAGKLTLQAAPGHSLAFSAFGDPTDRSGPLGSLASTPLHFQETRETGATDYALNYDGVVTDKFIVSARLAEHNEEDVTSGPGASVTGFIDFTDPLGDGTTVWGWPGRESGFGFFQNLDLSREQRNLDLTYFVNDFGGQHEFKAGYEFEDISGENENWNGGGGQRVYRFNCNPAVRFCGDPAQPYYYRHRYYIDPALEDDDPTTFTTASIRAPLTTGIKTENEDLYLQDTWRPISNLTVNAGVRWGSQSLFNALGAVSADIDDNVAPRVGLIWDPTKTGKAKVFWHFGRFYETIPMDIVIRSFGNEVQIFAYNLSDDPNDVAHDPRVRSSRVLGGGISRVDPGTKGQYLNEFVIGGEYEVRDGLSVGVKYINRDLKSVIEDALAADGDYFIGNPGRGQMIGTYDLGYAFGYNDTLHLLDDPKREFDGVEVSVSKRLTKNFQFLASALWSELKGSYDGTFQASTGQLDPNLNSAFDYFDFSVNNEGLLSNDRTWQFKFDGIYRFAFGMNAGFSAYYREGTPITAMGYSTAYNNWEYYLSRRGAFGRVDPDYEIDVHLGYPVKLRKGMELNLLLDIFNLLDVQTETRRSTRYTTADELCFGICPINWETGEITTIVPGDTRFPPTNPAFNTATDWTDPRSIRIGARLSF